MICCSFHMFVLIFMVFSPTKYFILLYDNHINTNYILYIIEYLFSMKYYLLNILVVRITRWTPLQIYSCCTCLSLKYTYSHNSIHHKTHLTKIVTQQKSILYLDKDIHRNQFMRFHAKSDCFRPMGWKVVGGTRKGLRN